jgi:hypothetical protein
MTEAQVDAEMKGLLIKISEQDAGVEPEYEPEPVITQRIKRKVDAVVPTDPLIEAQFRMKERLSETSRRDIPISSEYAEWMRRQALGDEENE